MSTRREFLTKAALAGVAGAAAAAGCSSNGSHEADASKSEPVATGPPKDRADAAYRVKVDAAARGRNEGVPQPQSNGDADRDPPGLASFSKGLPHDQHGVVDAESWNALDQAVRAKDFAAIERVDTGGPRRFISPLSSWATALVGLDSAQYRLDAPPAVNTDDAAGELAELYWMAEARDVPFTRWHDNTTIAAAVEDLRRFDVAGGKDLTVDTLFRGPAAGVHNGPYVSQYLWQRVKAAALPVEQRIRAYLPGFDFLTTWDDWLQSQNGVPSQRPSPATPRFVHSARDLASYVHRDYAFQLPLHAALILLDSADDNDAVDVTVPYSDASPYTKARVQGPFADLGQPHVMEMLGLAANAALRAGWYHKWLVHRRLRPEEFAARVHRVVHDKLEFPVSHKMLDSPVLDRVFSRFGNGLLAQAYPDGCPLHPSYPSGHACIGGATATILKAFFDEDQEVDEPVIATDDGLALQAYDGPPLAIGGELNKLATNIAYGRNMGGIHYRSDGDGGMRLGEAVAIAILRDVRDTFPEPDVHWVFHDFEGKLVEI